MNIMNYIRSLGAELGIRKVGNTWPNPSLRRTPVAATRDGGSAFIEEAPVENKTAKLAITPEGKVALYDGGTLVYTYANRAAARRGAERRGIVVA